MQTAVVEPVGTTTTATTTKAHRGFHFPGFGHKNKEVIATSGVEHHHGLHHHQLHNNPHDEWSSRDLLLSIIPYIIALAFKDAALNAGLIVASAISLYVLCKRFSFWGGYGKGVWPVIDITNVILFVILLGTSWKYREYVHKWIVVIASAALAFVAFLSLVRRRPFTAHYARYSPHDMHGLALWKSDLSWRMHNDLSTGAWVWAWTCAAVLALAPSLTGRWDGFTALNIIFNYIVPFLLVATALMITQLMGRRYSSNAVSSAGVVGTTTATTYAPGTAAYAPGTATYAPTTAVGPNVV